MPRPKTPKLTPEQTQFAMQWATYANRLIYPHRIVNAANHQKIWKNLHKVDGITKCEWHRAYKAYVCKSPEMANLVYDESYIVNFMQERRPGRFFVIETDPLPAGAPGPGDGDPYEYQEGSSPKSHESAQKPAENGEAEPEAKEREGGLSGQRSGSAASGNKRAGPAADGQETAEPKTKRTRFRPRTTNRNQAASVAEYTKKQRSREKVEPKPEEDDAIVVKQAQTSSAELSGVTVSRSGSKSDSPPKKVDEEVENMEVEDTDENDKEENTASVPSRGLYWATVITRLPNTVKPLRQLDKSKFAHFIDSSDKLTTALLSATSIKMPRARTPILTQTQTRLALQWATYANRLYHHEGIIDAADNEHAWEILRHVEADITPIEWCRAYVATLRNSSEMQNVELDMDFIVNYILERTGRRENRRSKKDRLIPKRWHERYMCTLRGSPEIRDLQYNEQCILDFSQPFAEQSDNETAQHGATIHGAQDQVDEMLEHTEAESRERQPGRLEGGSEEAHSEGGDPDTDTPSQKCARDDTTVDENDSVQPKR
ncbi:hypothetical protein BT63DRAFT_454461 [Microthyrium microscopicum]|uniref:Uncharacterized protein n=1 Tax=Microthyrium microscopicum TaxID=703497 RepID=A0A6A6UF69_9PEZI|nr:hypothetical protein BT63DRAFT_454461 [Microthyrium microscopicum]